MNETFTVKESFTLPSKGKIYDKPIISTIELRSMNMREEMLRQSSTDRPYKLLADIIEGCIVSEKPAIKVYDMCIGDYEFLLHKLRVVTYGPEYKMTVQCPNPLCGHIETKVFNLDDFEVLDFDPAEYEKLRDVELPVSGKIVRLKIETPRMLDDIEAGIKAFMKRNKDVQINPRELIVLRTVIEKVDGNTLSEEQLETFISELPARDSNLLKNRLDRLNATVGLDTKFNYECSKCHFDAITPFRSGPEFFGPSDD